MQKKLNILFSVRWNEIGTNNWFVKHWWQIIYTTCLEKEIIKQICCVDQYGRILDWCCQHESFDCMDCSFSYRLQYLSDVILLCFFLLYKYNWITLYRYTWWWSQDKAVRPNPTGKRQNNWDSKPVSRQKEFRNFFRWFLTDSHRNLLDFHWNSSEKIQKFSSRNTASEFRSFPMFFCRILGSFPLLSRRIRRDPVAGIFTWGVLGRNTNAPSNSFSLSFFCYEKKIFTAVLSLITFRLTFIENCTVFFSQEERCLRHQIEFFIVHRRLRH